MLHLIRCRIQKMGEKTRNVKSILLPSVASSFCKRIRGLLQSSVSKNTLCENGKEIVPDCILRTNLGGHLPCTDIW